MLADFFFAIGTQYHSRHDGVDHPSCWVVRLIRALECEARLLARSQKLPEKLQALIYHSP